MAGEMLGADPEHLRAFAKDMQSAGTALRRAAMTLSSVVSTVKWQGPDADNFRRSWGTHRKTMATVAGGLDAASDDLRRNAQEQVQASSVSSPDGSGQVYENPANAAANSGLIPTNSEE